MAGYNEIRGLRVKYLSDDPSGAEDGQVWYNSATGNLRVQGIGVAAWSSSSNALVARDTAASTGPQTSALVFGGATPSRTTATEEYNGSGWSTGGVLPTATTGMGSARNASQTAALGMGGYDGAKTGATFKYDGTSWTAAGTMGTPRQLYMVGGGTQTAAITFGGDTYPPAPSRNTTATEEYDGSSWTAANSLGTGGYSGAGTGPQSAAVRMGAPSTSNNTVTENFDGTNWTASGTIPISKSAMLAAGTQTASILFGGIPAPLSTTALEYDGSTYSAIPSPAISKYNNAGGGSSSAAFMSHGRTPAPAFVTTTEQYNFSASTITAGAWSSGENMNTARRGIMSAKNATQTAALGALGYTGSSTGVNNAEAYDGSSWTNLTVVPSSRYFGGGFGIQTAAVIFGGYRAPSQRDTTDEWDGSSWATGGTLPSGQSNMTADGCGILTAGLASLGMPGPSPTTIEYDGTNWSTSPGTLNTPRSSGCAFGTQTAAITATGNVPGSPGASLASESYNGTSWTATNNAIYGGYGNGGGGTQTAGIIAGGPASTDTNVQGWDGTNWSTSPAIATGRSEAGGAGTATAGIIFAGATTNPTTYSAATEEFTGATETITASTLTTS